MSIIRIQKLFVIGNTLVIFYLTNKETSKGWVCDNFPRQFHFFLGANHEKYKFKYFKNLTINVCKIWCNDVYMSILQCDIFGWKLIDRNFFNPIFNKYQGGPWGIPPFLQFPLFCTWLSPNRIFRYARYFIFIQQHSIVLKPKYCLSIRNKCAYLLESSETSITIWRQEYPKIAIFRMRYGENGTVKFFETLADNVFRPQGLESLS